jgi:hypothetical protein
VESTFHVRCFKEAPAQRRLGTFALHSGLRSGFSPG